MPFEIWGDDSLKNLKGRRLRFEIWGLDSLKNLGGTLLAAVIEEVFGAIRIGELEISSCKFT